MRGSSSDISLRNRLTGFSKTISVVVILIGLASLVGWALGIPLLIQFRTGYAATNPLTGLLYVMLGLGLSLRVRQAVHPDNSFQISSSVLGGSVALTAFLNLAHHLCGLDLQIDHLMFQNRLDSYSYSAMAPNEAVCFLFSGVALMLFDAQTKPGFRPAQALILAQGLIALLALLGYGYRALSLYKLPSPIPMSLASALAAGLWTLAALAARPGDGMMQVITSRTAGGAMARRLLPTALLVPVLLATLWLIAEKAGYLEAGAGVSLFAVSTIIIFTSLIWWNARLLFRADLERMRTESHLAVQYQCTRVLAEAPDLAQALPKILEAVCESVDWPIGLAWQMDEEANVLRCSAVWSSGSPKSKQFVEVSEKMTFPIGKGLPGRVWATAAPVWIADVSRDENFPRAVDAAQAGLHGAFGFPIRIDEETLGIIECFSRKIERPDKALLDMLAAIGSQIGQFVERHRAEEQLRKTSSDLARSNTDLQQFAYVASHDLFEPLRMVISFLQLLKEHFGEKVDKESEEFITFAMDGAHRMQALINDLLAYSRVDQRAQTLEVVNCEDALAAAVGNLKVAIEESHATINHTALPMVRGDIVQLIQLFQNLIGNAMKFHGTATPRIDITAELKNEEWVFSFRDNGIGIDPKHFSRIFEIFQRLHTRQEYAGTGIGLAICKRIVERHGGRMWVESSPGHGSNFLFTLPRLKETTDEQLAVDANSSDKSPPRQVVAKDS